MKHPNLALTMLLPLLVHCSSVSIKRTSTPLQLSGPLSELSSVELGVTEAALYKILGPPTGTNVEKLAQNEFRIVEYQSRDGVQLAFFTLDANSRVSARSYWIEPNQVESDFHKLLGSHFSGVHFKSYVPWETTGQQLFEIAEDLGVIIAHDGAVTQFISWSTPELTAMRVAQFEKNCSKLQHQGK